MGCYDTTPKGAQVKLWDCNFKRIEVGSEVEDYRPAEYIVLLQEGGYIRVKNGIVMEIIEDDKPRYPEEFVPLPCYDKWGADIETTEDLKSRDMFGYNYYHFYEERIEKGED